ncbi:MAG: 7TM domain-containing protein, partial [Patescibacteria group bacterium]
TVLISSSIFPILIIILLVERFVSTQIEKGERTAVLVTIETIVLSILCFFIAEWIWFRELLFDHPQWVLLTLVVNAFLGRWTGLRLREYFRFREVLKYVDDPKKK